METVESLFFSYPAHTSCFPVLFKNMAAETTEFLR